MPGIRCAIFGCKNSRCATKEKSPEITYHTFPKNDTIRNEWIDCCGRVGTWNPKNCKVCSIHFTEDDYERDLRNELLGKNSRIYRAFSVYNLGGDLLCERTDII